MKNDRLPPHAAIIADNERTPASPKEGDVIFIQCPKGMIPKIIKRRPQLFGGVVDVPTFADDRKGYFKKYTAKENKWVGNFETAYWMEL